MYSTTLIQIINCFVLISSEIGLKDVNYFPDYDNRDFGSNKNIRQSFIQNRKRNDETAKRIQLLDKYLPNNTVYVDEIAHFEILRNHSEWKKVNEIEVEFRNLIGMRGLTYIFKRDMFWRTWRLVHYPVNVIKLVSYVCRDPVNVTKYLNCYWAIEEKSMPACPYELFSIPEPDKFCAVHLNKYHDVKNSCSSEINISDLTGACDNPVLTEWRIEKKFNAKVSERFPRIICGGREFCTVTTMYKIADDYISFRIVNDTNDVIYSRIMKPGNRNFACIKDCGRMDPYSKTISTKEKSLRINLLSKKKREDVYVNKHAQLPFVKIKKNDQPNNTNIIYRWIKKINEKDSLVTTIAPTCKAMKLSIVQDEWDEDYSSSNDNVV